ncbi:MAG TPA: hypothetical protein VJS92_08875 [Candidatus Polarisedimenticolaceae bacterium]|nr:hypothetical protein [Candidatus Polarisedimenticolaceae bacterium]
MRRSHRWAASCLLLAGLAAAACAPLERRREAEYLEGIPLEYGELVAVTAHPERQFEAILWFQKPDKTLVLVPMNVSRGLVSAEVRTVSRR